MSRDEILSDLDYVKTMAEEGAHAPLLGGRIGLLWGILLVPTLIANGLASKGQFFIPEDQIGIIWLAFAVIGVLGSVILGRSIGRKPGVGSVGNRIQGAIWPAVSLSIFMYAISLGVAVGTNDLPRMIFDTVMPFAFFLSAVALWVLARTSGGQAYLKYAAITSGVSGALCAMLIGNPITYIVAAIGALVSNVIPNLIEIRREPKNVV